MLVNEPSFSTCAAAGSRKTSVAISDVESSPVSISARRTRTMRTRSRGGRARPASRGGQRPAVQPPVHRADDGVLTPQEEAGDRAVDHVHDRLVDRVVAGDARQPVEAEVVVGCRRVTEPGLEQRHQVGVHVAPEAGGRRVLLHEVLEALVDLRPGHGDVARQEVVQRRDVGRALNARVAAQGQDPSAGPTHVPEQRLHDRRGADVLHPHGVVRPADRVGERAGPLAAAVVAQGLGDLAEQLLRDPTGALDHLRRVAGVVPLQQLEDAARVLERLVAVRRAGVLEAAAEGCPAGAVLLTLGGVRLALPGDAVASKPSNCQDEVS